LLIGTAMMFLASGCVGMETKVGLTTNEGPRGGGNAAR
jgi:hypothetical protein